MYKFGKESLKKLSTCDLKLQDLMNYAITHKDCPCDFTIICGYRGEKEQNEAYAKGYSKLKFPNGNHNKNPSKAIDVMPYPVNWDKVDFVKLNALVKHIKKCAKELNINVVWGGDWKGFKDNPHWELKI